MKFSSKDILDAMNVLAKSEMEKAKFDKTIEATIVSLENAETGEYYILYESNKMLAYARDLTYFYDVDDLVYVKIPNGDFSGRKFIEGIVDRKSLTEQELNRLNKTINEVEPDWSSFYGYDKTSSWGIVSGVDRGDGDFSRLIWKRSSNELTDSDKIFANYAKAYDKIMIKASFLTNFVGTHSTGNYGLEVNFLANDFDENGDPTTKIVTSHLDLTSFVGNPYRYTVYSPQYVVIDNTDNFLVGLHSIYLTQAGMEIDKSYNIDGDLIFQNPDLKNNIKEKNIFVKDIELKFVELVDLSGSQYHLSIITPQGNTFTNQQTDLTLKAKLTYSGKELIENTSKCQVLWFIEDYTVVAGDERLNQNVGYRWRPIDETSYNTLVVNTSEVKCEQRYKVLVIYNNEGVFTAETTLYQLNPEYDITLEQITQGEDIILKIVNNSNGKVVRGQWWVGYPDGAYVYVDEDLNNKDTLVVNPFLYYSYSVFYCRVYDGTNNFIVNKYAIINNSNSDTDIEVSYEGTDMYLYDANGDITVDEAEKERTLQVNISWKNGYGGNYKIQWFGPDGQELGHTYPGVTPNNSMLKNMYVDSNNVLHYSILQKYKNKAIHNDLTLRITTVGGQIYTYSKEILFFKSGDPGTNGTTYTCVVRPCDDGGVKSSSFRTLHYLSSSWSNTTINLRCYVYKDGVLINGNSNYTIGFDWSTDDTVKDIFRLTKINNGDIITLSGQGSLGLSNSAIAGRNFIIKTQVSVMPKNMNEKGTTLYYNYPVPISVGSVTDSMVDTNIPQYVMYSSSGTNPTYADEDLYFEYDGANYIGDVTSYTTELVTVEAPNTLHEGYKLSVASRFNFDTGIGSLKLFIRTNTYIIYPIMMYLNTYGNEALNSWDGTSIKLDDKNGAVLAPQVGAGSKNSDGTFTGVVMGTVQGVQNANQGNTTNGLFGFYQGMNTFGLLANTGQAYFGKNKEISIEPNSAMITGKESNAGKTMTLRLTAERDTTKAIEFSSGNFYVTYDGKIHATEAYISGEIQASSGKIGGWTIGSSTLSSGGITLQSGTGSNAYIQVGRNKLNGDGSASFGSRLSISSDGTLTCSNANVTGTIVATSGKIGNWFIKNGNIQSSSGENGETPNVRLNVSGNTGRIYTDYFMTNEGVRIGKFTYGEGNTGFGIVTGSNQKLRLQSDGGMDFLLTNPGALFNFNSPGGVQFQYNAGSDGAYFRVSNYRAIQFQGENGAPAPYSQFTVENMRNIRLNASNSIVLTAQDGGPQIQVDSTGITFNNVTAAQTRGVYARFA